MLNIKAFLSNVTHQPGVYQMRDEAGTILYIGKARNLKKRLASYFSAKSQDIKTRTMLKHVEDIDITVTNTENEALLLECNLIKKHKPHYNILFRDDKSYLSGTPLRQFSQPIPAYFRIYSHISGIFVWDVELAEEKLKEALAGTRLAGSPNDSYRV